MSLRLVGLFIAILGASGVGMGAFGAHALKDQLTAAGHLENWRTAVSYQMIHVVAALALWVLLTAVQERLARPTLLRAAIVCWLTGLILFSGSLYGLCLGGPRWLGPVTPLGGLALIAGWLCVAAAGMPKKSA